MKPKIMDEAEFRSDMKRLIAEDKHVDYFTELIKQFDYYKSTFEGIFAEPKQAIKDRNMVYSFLVEYKGAGGGSAKTLVMRVFNLMGNQTFEALASQTILSMGWVYDHMHGYELVGKKRLADPLHSGSSLAMFTEGWEDDPHPTYKTSQIHISDIDYSVQPKFEFMFDYGDGHTFIVTSKGTRMMVPLDSPSDFPLLIASSGGAPDQYPDLDGEE